MRQLQRKISIGSLSRQPLQVSNTKNKHANTFDELFDSEQWEHPYDFNIPKYPLLVDIEPTNHCNFTCKFCNREIMKRPKGYMDFRLYERIIKQLFGKVFYLKFSRWGEPFLHPQIYDMFRLAKKHIIKVHVTTNGSLVDIDRLQDVDTIYFSMQGLNKNDYKDLRGNSFIDLKRKIRELSKHPNKKRPHVCLSTSVLDEKPIEVKAFVDYWSQIVDKVQVGRTTFTWLGKNDYIKKQTFKLRSEPCRDIRLRLSIDWNGDVTPCCTDFDGFMTIGNIGKNTIEQLWRNDKIEYMRKQIKERNFGFNKLCARCNQQW